MAALVHCIEVPALRVLVAIETGSGRDLEPLRLRLA